MDNMAYLQQIATPTPKKTPPLLASLFENKLVKICLGLAGLAILIMIIAPLFTVNTTDNTDRERDLILNTQLRSTNLISTIDTYTPKLKSSALRSASRSLATVLSETNRDLSAIIESSFASAVASDDLTADEEVYITSVNDILNTAYLNAHLDHNYARQISLEITLLLSLESEALARTEKDDLTAALEKSSENLSTLYEDFNSFSNSNL